MNMKRVFTVGFFLTIVPILWLVVSLARGGVYFDRISILVAVCGGGVLTLAARFTYEKDPTNPREPESEKRL